MVGRLGKYLTILCLLILPFIYKGLPGYCAFVKSTQQSIPVYIRYSGPKFNFPDLIEASQIQVDAESHRLFLNKIILLLEEEDHVHRDDYNKFEEYIMELIFHDQDYVGTDANSKTVLLYYSSKAIHNNDLPFNIAQAVIYHLLRDKHSNKQRKQDEDERNIELR